MIRRVYSKNDIEHTLFLRTWINKRLGAQVFRRVEYYSKKACDGYYRLHHQTIPYLLNFTLEKSPMKKFGKESNFLSQDGVWWKVGKLVLAQAALCRITKGVWKRFWAGLSGNIDDWVIKALLTTYAYDQILRIETMVRWSFKHSHRLTNSLQTAFLPQKHHD